MAEIGYAISSEEHAPNDLVKNARRAEEVGFTFALISDHFHPWVDEQGQSPFVWSVLGAIGATTDLRVGTGVTCPTFRIHPAIIAQAAASTAEMCRGGFFLGVGSGENLNEHILGDRWPEADERLSMLEEAVALIRELWKGETTSWDGEWYKVDNARIYTRPQETPLITVSGFGPKATELAARIGDGFVNTSPDKELVQLYRDRGGRGPIQAMVKVCWAESEEAARTLAHERWPNSGLPGELAQELKTPNHFMQACELVDEETATGKFALGPDPERHVQTLQEYLDAGFTELFVQQIGPDQEGFLSFWKGELAPRLGL